MISTPIACNLCSSSIRTKRHTETKRLEIDYGFALVYKGADQLRLSEYPGDSEIHICGSCVHRLQNKFSK